MEKVPFKKRRRPSIKKGPTIEEVRKKRREEKEKKRREDSKKKEYQRRKEQIEEQRRETEKLQYVIISFIDITSRKPGIILYQGKEYQLVGQDREKVTFLCTECRENIWFNTINKQYYKLKKEQLPPITLQLTQMKLMISQQQQKQLTTPLQIPQIIDHTKEEIILLGKNISCKEIEGVEVFKGVKGSNFANIYYDGYNYKRYQKKLQRGYWYYFCHTYYRRKTKCRMNHFGPDGHCGTQKFLWYHKETNKWYININATHKHGVHSEEDDNHEYDKNVSIEKKIKLKRRPTVYDLTIESSKLIEQMNPISDTVTNARNVLLFETDQNRRNILNQTIQNANTQMNLLFKKVNVINKKIKDYKKKN